jgi:thioredoxin-related protein
MPLTMNTTSNTGKMKRILFFISMIAAIGCSQAQTSGQQASAQPSAPPQPAKPVLHIDKVPAFRILTQDSVYVNNSILQNDKAVIFIYFSPDCSHCQRMMYELKPYMKDFSKTQVVMVTFIQTSYLKLLKEFRRDFSLGSYPNWITGTEYPDYKLQRYFQVATTPFIAIYDRKGKLVKYFDKLPKDITDIVDVVKKV